jgi:hypothetical protein
MSKMNAAQRLDAAMRRMESAAAQLRQQALTFARVESGRWDQVIADRDLAAAARRYASSLASIRRAGKGA